MPAKNASNIILKPRNFLLFFMILIFCDLVAADIYNFVIQEREIYGRAVAERIQALERTAHAPTSCTYGLGFDYEKTFVGLVHKALKPKGIEVLNAAVPSYSPIIYWKKVEYLINKADFAPPNKE